MTQHVWRRNQRRLGANKLYANACVLLQVLGERAQSLKQVVSAGLSYNKGHLGLNNQLVHIEGVSLLPISSLLKVETLLLATVKGAAAFTTLLPGNRHCCAY